MADVVEGEGLGGGVGALADEDGGVSAVGDDEVGVAVAGDVADGGRGV